MPHGKPQPQSSKDATLRREKENRFQLSNDWGLRGGRGVTGCGDGSGGGPESEGVEVGWEGEGEGEDTSTALLLLCTVLYSWVHFHCSGLLCCNRIADTPKTLPRDSLD